MASPGRGACGGEHSYNLNGVRKKLREPKGPRPLLPRFRGGGCNWRGSNGRHRLTALLQASGGGGGRWLGRKKLGRHPRPPEALAPATSRPAPQRFGPPSPHSRRPFSGAVRFPQALGGGVSDPSPYSQPCPALPGSARSGSARPGPVPGTHGSDSSGGSSPAPASPPPTPG